VRARTPLLILTLLTAAVVGVLSAGRWLQVADPPLRSAAVVPLAGDRQRPAHAADLLLTGGAELLAITRLPLESESFREWYVRDVTAGAVAQGVPEGSVVVVPGVAPSTYGELENVRAFAEAEGWQTLTVVTSSWHTRRTRAIVRRVFRRSEVVVSVRPSPETRFPLGATWWRDPLGRTTVVSEYLKLAGLLVGVR
jgi:uncharacterized SAM-binding protein YcdF (DUF218 family)